MARSLPGYFIWIRFGYDGPTKLPSIFEMMLLICGSWSSPVHAALVLLLKEHSQLLTLGPQMSGRSVG